jgi:tetratricopeptide (TPR) repeat protein
MKPPPQVEVRRETVVLPTYEPHWPDPNPMFLEKRVYQGSSGRVYPLPFTDRISDRPEPRSWEAVWIENAYLSVQILPALGGRIHRIQDRTNGFDLIYHQTVIKPALVGLAGPWASGGIEFNWPQHHRPSTFMPADVSIERSRDGSATVWLGEHDPMARMKGMHGVRLHPGRSCLELVARAYNRTPQVQTFLWWANAAIQVHELYQSFFPGDVAHVADHARRAVSGFPLCTGKYYGVDYGARSERRGGTDAHLKYPPRNRKQGHGVAYKANDLSWYSNIPAPTSYMATGSREDFVGGYDHRAQAGVVHVADHHICPGKKQWTWGNDEFGYAWDRNLTDPDASGEYRPYIEVMAGSYTDNQPDFSFLQPGETKTWSQFWYPIRKIGPAHQANTESAVSLCVRRGVARVGICTTRRQTDARVTLLHLGRKFGSWTQTIGPERPLVFEADVGTGARLGDCEVRVSDREGRELIAHAPGARRPGAAPAPASEPPPPSAVATTDELFVIGLHLEQYRHATRLPESYWQEALRRDPGDARSNLALGRWRMGRGELAEAERLLRASVARLTSRNPNPYDGEAHYQLGLCLRSQALAADFDRTLLGEAYDAFSKAAWNEAWRGSSHHALAEIDAVRGVADRSLEHAEVALRSNPDNLRAADLKAVLLRKLGRGAEAEALLRGTLAADPLDWWARHLLGRPLACDAQVRLDLAHNYAWAGETAEALRVLGEARTPGPRAPEGAPPAPTLPDASLGSKPIVAYTQAWLCGIAGDRRKERLHLAAARRAPCDYCFPARLEEIAILTRAMRAMPRDPRAPLYLGNLLFDRRRHREAIRLWELAARLEPANPRAWRNLGIGYYNVLRRPAAARAAYRRAFKAAPKDARILYELDQLEKRLGASPPRRLAVLDRHPDLVRSRDDLSVELCALYNQTGRPERALEILASRTFQPWEGGEGLALRQHVRANLLVGRRALAAGDTRCAIRPFEAALGAPANLGEAHHPLANAADALYWLGCALAAAGDARGARARWTQASRSRGDFQAMEVRPVSELTYYSAMARRRLGDRAGAARAFRGILAHARALAAAPASVDYFATSLPTMLLFDDDIGARQATTALFLEAQACLGLGRRAAGLALLRRVQRRDPSHPFASDQPT